MVYIKLTPMVNTRCRPSKGQVGSPSRESQGGPQALDDTVLSFRANALPTATTDRVYGQNRRRVCTSTPWKS